jgi:glycosyltransferase involved in cell wall biosynthesis
MKLSVCLIVKNEQALLARCLNSVKDADEIIVCDTGSTDQTINIALQFTDKVFTDYVWNDDFAEARNHALSKASGQWVLSIDADEVLQPGGIQIIRHIIENNPESKGFFVNMVDEKSGAAHKLIRLFKNKDYIRWVCHGGGFVHETVDVKSDDAPVVITYGYSPAHALDPDIDMRLLVKSVKQFPDNVRNYYYLAREFYYRQDFRSAVNMLNTYLQHSTFIAEKADAWLLLSRCHWALNEGESARVCCLNAININANFKEAVLFMAELSWEHNAVVWRAFAQLCSNSGVLFVRN